MRATRALTLPLRRYFSPRFEAIASRLDRIEGAVGAMSSSMAAPSAQAHLEAPPMALPPPAFPSFNDLLHHLRGVELARMPRVQGTMLSAGCAGSYYFRWIAEEYGPVDKHIGLELYLPEPDDLPPWVEWVRSSVSVMEGIVDGSVELVFSGQNFEHLFGDDAVDFLVECHRVLADDGWLVMDSPNRQIAAGLR